MIFLPHYMWAENRKLNNFYIEIRTLIGTTGTFYKFLLVTKLMHDFIKFSRKPPCIKTSLMQFKFIKLPIRCIMNLAAILSREILQVSKNAFVISKAAETFVNFTVVSMLKNFSHIISFEGASYSACYLTNGVYIRYLIEKVIAAARKWRSFQF